MSISRFLNSFKHAYQGIKKVFKEEQNFKIHFFIAVAVLYVSIFFLSFNYIEIILVLICIALVLITEIINTVIENSWDHLEPNHHPVVKSVKDMMAGAVLLISGFSVIVWILIIIHKLYS